MNVTMLSAVLNRIIIFCFDVCNLPLFDDAMLAYLTILSLHLKDNKYTEVNKVFALLKI